MKLLIVGMSAVFCCAVMHVHAEAQVGYVTESIKDNVLTERPVRTDDFGDRIQEVLRKTKVGAELSQDNRIELFNIATELRFPVKDGSCYAIPKREYIKVPATNPAKQPPSNSSSSSQAYSYYNLPRDYESNYAKYGGLGQQTTGGDTPPSTYVPKPVYSNVPLNQKPSNRPLPVTLITYEPEDLCTVLGLANCPDSDRY